MAGRVGQTVSHYRILQHPGGGGMGVVYKAQDLKLDRQIALKFLPPDLTRDPDAKQRFLQEAKAASALDYQNICNVHDLGETDDGQFLIVMAYYEGETLQRTLERGPWKWNERKTPGSYEVTYNPAGLASGVFDYRLTAGSFERSRRMLLVR